METIITKFNKAINQDTKYNNDTKRWLNPKTGNWVKQLRNTEKRAKYKNEWYEKNKTKVSQYDKDRYNENKDNTPLKNKLHNVYSIILTKPDCKDIIYIGTTSQSLKKRVSFQKTHDNSQYFEALKKGYSIKYSRILFDKIDRKKAFKIESEMIEFHSEENNKFECINIIGNKNYKNTIFYKGYEETVEENDFDEFVDEDDFSIGFDSLSCDNEKTDDFDFDFEF